MDGGPINARFVLFARSARSGEFRKPGTAAAFSRTVVFACMLLVCARCLLAAQSPAAAAPQRFAVVLDAAHGGDDLGAKLQTGSADLAARLDAQAAKLDAVAVAHTDNIARLAQAFERRTADLGQTLQALIDTIAHSHSAEREASNATQRVERERLEQLLDESARELDDARARITALSAFRAAILASRMGRWLAARSGPGVAHAPSEPRN